MNPTNTPEAHVARRCSRRPFGTQSTVTLPRRGMREPPQREGLDTQQGSLCPSSTAHFLRQNIHGFPNPLSRGADDNTRRHFGPIKCKIRPILGRCLDTIPAPKRLVKPVDLTPASSNVSPSTFRPAAVATPRGSLRCREYPLELHRGQDHGFRVESRSLHAWCCNKPLRDSPSTP